jgi:hypothetical protein
VAALATTQIRIAIPKAFDGCGWWWGQPQSALLNGAGK